MNLSMPVLHSICMNEGKYENIVLLNINHDMANSYVFSAELQNLFGKVIQVSSSYTASTAEDRKPLAGGSYYYAVPNRNKTFSLQHSEAPLRIRTYSFSDTMDSMITIAIAADVMPEIRNGKKLFIIEDGGYHAAIMDNLVEIWPELKGKIIGSVEQTTSGTKILSSRSESRYPSVSIARSEIKMCLESVFIGQRIVEELSSFIAYTNHFLNYAPVTVIGYGIFGRAVVKKLEGYRCELTVCDKDEVIRTAAEREGIPAFAEITAESFHDHQIFIAMTGNKSFGIRELKQYLASDADDILLSSGSSKDIEYGDILELIREPDGGPLTVSQTESGPFYEKYTVSEGSRSKSFYIIANGMPVNFRREGSISLTDKMMDLVFAEMAMCTVSVIEAGVIPNGLYLLGDPEAPVKMDEWSMIRKWFACNGLHFSEEHPEECLFLHPCREYLRQSTFRRLSIKEMI